MHAIEFYENYLDEAIFSALTVNIRLRELMAPLLVYPMLIPVLPDKSSLKRSYYMHIHEDNSKPAHIRAAAAFIATEVTEAQAMFEGTV